MTKSINKVSSIVRVKRNAVEVLPDSDRYKCRFKIRSESTNQLYLVSLDTSGPYWCCSCRGCIRWGTCKHLEAMGLKGRAFGKNLPENHKYLQELSQVIS